MKIKIGTISEEITGMSNDIYKTPEVSERLFVNLKNTGRTVAEINTLISDNYVDTIVFVDDNGKEETFTGYSLESIRKSYESKFTQIVIEFKKQEGRTETVIEQL